MTMGQWMSNTQSTLDWSDTHYPPAGCQLSIVIFPVHQYEPPVIEDREWAGRDRNDDTLGAATSSRNLSPPLAYSIVSFTK